MTTRSRVRLRRQLSRNNRGELRAGRWLSALHRLRARYRLRASRLRANRRMCGSRRLGALQGLRALYQLRSGRRPPESDLLRTGLQLRARRRLRGDEGSGTVLTLAGVAALIVLLAGAAGLAQVVAGSQRAGSAADLAALAVAQHIDPPSAGASECSWEASGLAARVAAVNRAQLISCRVSSDGSVAVTTEVVVSGVLGAQVGPAVGRARARLPP